VEALAGARHSGLGGAEIGANYGPSQDGSPVLGCGCAHKRVGFRRRAQAATL